MGEAYLSVGAYSRIYGTAKSLYCSSDLDNDKKLIFNISHPLRKH